MSDISFMIPMVHDEETGLNKRDHFSEMLAGGIDPEAFYQAGLSCLEGDEQNIPQGVYWMTEAANEGCEKAIRYFDKHPELKPEGADWKIPTIEDKITKAEAGDENEIFGLANLYLNGDEEVEQDPQMAVYWMKKLADLENPVAYFNMGLFYAKGFGVERDFDKAAEWMQRAADEGDDDGEPAAMKYKKMAGLEKRAKSGDIKAMSEFAIALVLGAGSLVQAGREKDDNEAIELANAVAKSGDVQLITELATEFMKKGMSLDDESAQTALYRVAVDLAKAAGDYGDAIWVLALAYEHGRGVEEDLDKAIEYYKKGAELGHAPCQHSYGCFFLRGDYLESNPKFGVEWVLKSADQGYNLANFTLATAYAEGLGVERDLDKAVEYGEKAAENGDVDMQYEIGKLFTAEGKRPGSMINKKRAKYWYQRAAEGGHFIAQLAMEIMWGEKKKK